MMRIAPMTEKTGEFLKKLSADVRDEFERNRRIMSFGQFIEALEQNPTLHTRSVAQYVRDCVHFYGTSQVDTITGPTTRFNLFDAPFDDERERMLGQEAAQQRVVKLFENFARGGRVDKLILLHGPNGSAKSTFIKMIMRALEHYCTTDEGAIYKFNWVFPTEKLAGARSGIGFGESAVSKEQLATFAHLDEDVIDARLADNLHDHPLLLLPPERRQALFEHIFPDGTPADFVLSEYVVRGELSHTNKLIFDALLTAYRGDLEAVLKHVQIERFYYSRRYRRGCVTVEPQMRVDAGVRQLTADRSLQSLPPALQNLTLFEPVGDLIDANRGVIEYDDMFKRHLDLNKYLLSASERGSVTLETQIVHLDEILIATGNETYLDAFKQTADYASFKGRVELVRLPYLLDYRAEREIYDEQLERVDVGKFVAPHTTFVAAMWAVLTRLRRPDPDAFPAGLRDVISGLTPTQKAELYSSGRPPEALGAERARLLKAHIATMFAEASKTTAYEGRYGASPREMKMILLNAGQNPAYACLSPLAVLDELALLVRDKSVFPFLQMKPDGKYLQHEAFIQTVRDLYLDILDNEIQTAMGLVDEDQYKDLFARYIDHVSQSVKGEKVYNKVTKRDEDPDEQFMLELEQKMGVEEDADRQDYRTGLISSIAAAFIDNPEAGVDYLEIFPQQFAALRRSVYDERAKQIRKTQQNMLIFFEGDDDQLTPQELQVVEHTLTTLRERFGHSDESAREALAFLMATRYKKVDA